MAAKFKYGTAFKMKAIKELTKAQLLPPTKHDRQKVTYKKVDETMTYKFRLGIKLLFTITIVAEGKELLVESHSIESLKLDNIMKKVGARFDYELITIDQAIDETIDEAIDQS